MTDGERSTIQGICRLEDFGVELPTIEATDGPYVPIAALCAVLGLPARTHIGVTCRQYKAAGVIARLPVWAGNAYKEMWCLRRDHVYPWLATRSLRLVPQDRLEPLRRARERWMREAHRVYTSMITEHNNEARRIAFQILAYCASKDDEICSYEQNVLPGLQGEQRHQLVQHLATGRSLLRALADPGREIVAVMAEPKFIQGDAVNREHEVEAWQFALFPITLDMSRYTESMDRFLSWEEVFTQWVEDEGLG